MQRICQIRRCDAVPSLILLLPLLAAKQFQQLYDSNRFRCWACNICLARDAAPSDRPHSFSLAALHSSSISQFVREPGPEQTQRSPTTCRAQVYVAELDPVLNVRTLTDYDVKRFFTQFGATPLGVWSNPIGNWVEDKDDMELRNTYMYGLDVMFHRCVPARCNFACPLLVNRTAALLLSLSCSGLR